MHKIATVAEQIHPIKVCEAKITSINTANVSEHIFRAKTHYFEKVAHIELDFE